MMTQNFSYSRILAVWLVLLAFFCGMILPSIAIARMEFTIATEGDPGDGLENNGGGGGSGDEGILGKGVFICEPHSYGPGEIRQFNDYYELGFSNLDLEIYSLYDGSVIWIFPPNKYFWQVKRGLN